MSNHQQQQALPHSHLTPNSIHEMVHGTLSIGSGAPSIVVDIFPDRALVQTLSGQYHSYAYVSDGSHILHCRLLRKENIAEPQPTTTMPLPYTAIVQGYVTSPHTVTYGFGAKLTLQVERVPAGRPAVTVTTTSANNNINNNTKNTNATRAKNARSRKRGRCNTNTTTIVAPTRLVQPTEYYCTPDPPPTPPPKTNSNRSRRGTSSSSSDESNTNNSSNTTPETRVQGGFLPLFLETWGTYISMDELVARACKFDPNMDQRVLRASGEVTLDELELLVARGCWAQHAAYRSYQRKQQQVAACETESNTQANVASVRRNHENRGADSMDLKDVAEAVAEAADTTTPWSPANRTNYRHRPIASMHPEEVPVYERILERYAAEQREQQVESLRSNRRRSTKETPETAQQIATQYQLALACVLDDDDDDINTDNDVTPLTVAQLHDWHGTLCQGLVPDAGFFRSKSVRVGKTRCPPAPKVPGEIDRLLETWLALDNRMVTPPLPDDQQPNSDPRTAGPLRCAVMASILFLGLIDVHPYADGNGRLSRLALNWALQYTGFPFCVTLFSCDQERIRHVEAVREVRRNTQLVAHGWAEGGTLSTIAGPRYANGSSSSIEDDDSPVLSAHEALTLSLRGALQPMVSYVLSRMHDASHFFAMRLEKEWTRIEQEAWEEPARKHRERAAEGSCFICMDGAPNISTLCCGKAVHLNCMAQWLSCHTTCPQCRKEMPSLPNALNNRPRFEQLDSHTSDASGEDHARREPVRLQPSDTETYNESDDELPPNLLHPMMIMHQMMAAHMHRDDTSSFYSDELRDHNTTFDDFESDVEDGTRETETAANAFLRAARAVQEGRQPIQVQQQHDSTTATDDDESENADAYHDMPALLPNQHGDTSSTMDDVDETEETTSDVEQIAADETTETDDEGDTQQQASAMGVLYCFNCSNRAARDCSNMACGRCCELSGNDCDRHS